MRCDVATGMIWLSQSCIWQSLPIFVLILAKQISKTEAFLKTARIEEIPFSLIEKDPIKMGNIDLNQGIHAVKSLEQMRGFLHLFHVPYIVCFFAAKGKWPFIPPILQLQVDTTAKTLFAHNDGFIKQFCQKFIQIKECFRPLFATATVATVEALSKVRATSCPCATDNPVVFFDRDHIGNVSSDTILNTIEFLENFLPAPTKKTKRRKTRVRGRVDEMEVE